VVVGKKEKYMANNDNESKDLSMNLAKTVVESVTNTYNLNKTMQILICDDMGLSGEECAIVVNSTPGYVHNVVRRKRTDSKLRERFTQLVLEFPDWYRGVKMAQLPALAAAESKALERYLQDPELIIKHPALARQLRIAGGVSEPEQKPIQVNVNLALLQGSQEAALEAAFSIDAPKVITVEPDETT
jgi:hypothetical protein